MSFKYEFIVIAKETGKVALNAVIMACIVYIAKGMIVFSSEIINLGIYVIIGVITYGLLTTITDFKFVRKFLLGKGKME
ncbi:hypothetical protein [Listeria aquatica]|nr:hypothetical protein [Listeria aquatica]EUJ18058.1 hypothetical protein MAQA_09851 [Listeria aquatica FSL S10-1188]